MTSLLQRTRRWIDAAGVAIFPPRCGACDAPLTVRPPGGLCPPCTEILTSNDGPRCRRCDLPDQGTPCPPCRDHAPSFSELRAPFLYGGPLADLIVAAKFKGREELAAAVGRLVAAALQTEGWAGDGDALWAPVPLGRARQRRRGYNQSAIIARVVARARRGQVIYPLVRARETLAQSDLPLRRRAANVRDAFAVRGKSVAGRTIILVDDVVTSGETVRQAAAALRAAGATDVRVVAAARAP